MTESERGARQRYIYKNYDTLNIKLRKPGGEILKTAAAEAGESQRQFIIRAINARLDGEKVQ